MTFEKCLQGQKMDYVVVYCSLCMRFSQYIQMEITKDVNENSVLIFFQTYLDLQISVQFLSWLFCFFLRCEL